MGRWNAAKLMTQTPCPVADKPLRGGQSSREGRREKRVSVTPRAEREAAGGARTYLEFSGVYVLQSSASNFSGFMGMTMNFPRLAAPLREAVERVEVCVAAPLPVLGVQRHTATEPPRLLSHHQLFTWGHTRLSGRAWAEGLCLHPASIPYPPRIRSFCSFSTCRMLVPRPGTEPVPSVEKAWSPNRWMAREFPQLTLLFFTDNKAWRC